MTLQRPSPNGAFRIVAHCTKEDGVADTCTPPAFPLAHTFHIQVMRHSRRRRRAVGTVGQAMQILAASVETEYSFDGLRRCDIQDFCAKANFPYTGHALISEISECAGYFRPPGRCSVPEMGAKRKPLIGLR